MSDETTRIMGPLFDWRSAICDSGLNATSRHVALTLSLHANARGESIFPSVDTLAAETARSKGSVMDALRAMEAAGWVEVDRPARTGRGHKNHYRLTVPTQGDDSEKGSVTVPISEPVDKIGNGTLSDGNGTVSPRNGRASVLEGVEGVVGRAGGRQRDRQLDMEPHYEELLPHSTGRSTLTVEEIRERREAVMREAAKVGMRPGETGERERKDIDG